MDEEKISSFDADPEASERNSAETPMLLGGPVSAKGIGRPVAGALMLKIGSWIWIALLFLCGSAFAQSKVVQEPDRTVYRKKTVIDFSDVAVEGELAKPEGSYVLDRRRTSFRSLVKVRDNFLPELQKSVDQL